MSRYKGFENEEWEFSKTSQISRLRVPGGYLYTMYDYREASTVTTFVPMSPEEAMMDVKNV